MKRNAAGLRAFVMCAVAFGSGCSGSGEMESERGFGGTSPRHPVTSGVGGVGGNPAANAGGSTTKAGSSKTGGSTAKGGTTAKGGASTFGGTTAKGGASTFGGTTAKGGSSAFGGRTATGGTTSTGGSTLFDGKGGAAAMGGSSAFGGATSKGGSSAFGGTTAAGGTSSAGFKRACVIPGGSMCTAHIGSGYDSTNAPGCTGTALDACPTADLLGRCVYLRSTVAEGAAYYYNGCLLCSSAATNCTATQGEWEAAP
jgi:hypothetical protein